MSSKRSRLLVLMVLLSVVAAAGWRTALAGGRTDSPSVFSSLASVSKPPALPASGEPDVGQTPRLEEDPGPPPLYHGKGGKSKGSRADAWVRWIFRMWTIRYLGAN